MAIAVFLYKRKRANSPYVYHCPQTEHTRTHKTFFPPQSTRSNTIKCTPSHTDIPVCTLKSTPTMMEKYLPSLTISDDQLTLSSANGNQGVNSLDPRHHWLTHRDTRDDPWGLHTNPNTLLGGNWTLHSVNGIVIVNTIEMRHQHRFVL